MSTMNSTTAPLITDQSLSLSAALYRPRWLLNREELEEVLSTFTVSLSDLRSDKNTSELVEKVLERTQQLRLQKSGFSQLEESSSYDFLARSYLASEIQTVLVSWAQQGLEATKKGSLYSGFWDPENLLSYEAESGMEESSAMRCRSISTTSSAGTADSQQSIDTNISSPSNSTPEDRPSKRRNMADGTTQDIYISPTRAPRLSLVTNSLFPETSAATYNYPESTSTCTSAKRKWADEQLSAMSGGYSLTPSSALFSASSANSPRSFIPLRNSMITSPLTPGGSEKAPYVCPYIKMNPNNKMHQKCRGKLYPNPRKLKEHIWQYTKPFRCKNCGEGYGRDKTRAIHIENRKIPCKPRPVSEWDDKGSGRYEGSREEERDNKIQAAKTTDEIVKILQEYERKTALANSTGSNKATIMQQFQDNNHFNHTAAASAATTYAGSTNSATNPDGVVPKITLQAYDVQALTTGGMNVCANFIPGIPDFTSPPPQITTTPTKSRTAALESQGWRPMPAPSCTPSSSANTTARKMKTTTTPARKPKAASLSPPTPHQSQFNNQSVTSNSNNSNNSRSTKSPTPELSNMCPSPASSHAESEISIYDSPMYTPTINVTTGSLDLPSDAAAAMYWNHDAAHTHHIQHQYVNSEHIVNGVGMSGAHHEVNGLGGNIDPDMGLQRRSTNGSMDALTYALLKETKDYSNYNFGNGY
ncbi:hypothetical protein DFH27DRAFT_300284 [Peziza echinospora]|nr:hypothetical protein DFH27DRAFT_300284 [Peziza echinospora]